MFARKLQVRLPRRITAYFLLFGLMALISLSVGAFFVARSVNQSWSESATLHELGRAANRLVLSYLQHGDAQFQSLVGEVRDQSNSGYCAIVSSGGDYLAHSTRDLVGQPATEHGGTIERWGDVLRVQYVGADGDLVDEYQAPLMAVNKQIGSLRIGRSNPSLWGWLRAGAQSAPLALLGPACFMVIGAVLLSRMVRPVADIEQQLLNVAVSPSVEGCRLCEVPSVGAAAAGWNRVVKERLNSPHDNSINQRLDRSLQSSRQHRLDAAINSIPDGMATTDREGVLTYTNLPMAAILAMSDVVSADDNHPATVAAPKMTDLLVKRWKLPAASPLLSADNRDRPVVTELVREERGQRRILRVARLPICVADSSAPETHVWTIRDVTQQKLADEMRDQFVDTATHELRTPLANIKAYAETLALADMIDVEQQKQFLNTINAEATRLGRFVDDLLSVSSMEIGSLSLSKQVTDLNRLLNEVFGKVRAQMDEKQLTFDTVLPDKLPEPMLDKDKISAVLVNLLGNAVKYTMPGGRVTLRVNVADQNIEISVEDTGVGIASHEVPRVFEKFFRSNDARVQEQPGTGLGLALAQEVVRLHGGRITVESELGKGSTFHVLLPMT
jgi:signal transduction histidine kinase